MTAKNSAELHDHIDSAISTDLADKAHYHVKQVLNDHENKDVLDHTHLNKIANHFMSTPHQDSDSDLLSSDNQTWSGLGSRSRTLEAVLNHPKTDSKTINQFLDHSAATGEVQPLESDTVNKLGVDAGKLTAYLAKQIHDSSIEPVGVSSEVLRNLKDMSNDMSTEDRDKIHGFIGQSYALGHRNDKDFVDFKPILHNVYEYSDNGTLKSLFDDKHDISHSSLIESYHNIDPKRRSTLLNDYSFNLLDHPNIDKDYVAAAALDSNHELNGKALQSKNLPDHVVDRLIADNNKEALQYVMGSNNIAPEHIEKLVEHAFQSEDSELIDNAQDMIGTYNDKLSTPTVSKLYSLYHGKGYTNRDTIEALAESKNSSDEVFMDAVSKGYNPSLNSKDSISPQLAEQLLTHSQYHRDLLTTDGVPDELKVKLAHQIPFKDVSSSWTFNRLPFVVQKEYYNQMVTNKKFDSKLASHIYFNQHATPEVKSDVIDRAVKTLNSKAKAKQGASFIAKCIEQKDPHVQDALSRLNDKAKVNIVNNIDYDVIKKLPLTKTDTVSLLKNPSVDENVKRGLAESNNVSIHTIFEDKSILDGVRSHSLSHNFFTRKIDNLEPSQANDFLSQALSPEKFSSLHPAMQSAILLHPNSKIDNLNLTGDEWNNINNGLSYNESIDLFNKMSPNQFNQYVDGKHIKEINVSDWNKIADKHHDKVVDLFHQAVDSKYDISNELNKDTINKIGHHVIDRALQNPTIVNPDRYANNTAQLYSYKQDPDHIRLKNMLVKNPANSDYVASLVEQQTGIHPFKDQSVVKNLLDFAPNGSMDNPEIWSLIADHGHLPESHQYLGALTSHMQADRYVENEFSRSEDHGVSAIDKLLGDKNVNNNIYVKMLKSKADYVNHNKYDGALAHKSTLADQIINGIKNGKVNAQNIGNFEDAVNSYIHLSDSIESESFIHQVVDSLHNTAIPSDKQVRFLRTIANNSNASYNVVQKIQNHIIDKLVDSRNYKSLLNFNAGTLTNIDKVWSPGELSSTEGNGSVMHFAAAANDQLVSNGKISNERNWLSAAKTLNDNIHKVGVDQLTSSLGDNIGKFIKAGISNPNTKDLSNLMAKAWSSKLSSKNDFDSGFYDFIKHLNGSSDSSYEVLEHVFDGIQGKVSSGLIPKDLIRRLSSRTTNEYQAQLLLESSDEQNPDMPKLLSKFVGMVSENSSLGQSIGSKLSIFSNLIDSDELHKTVSTLAQKDVNGFNSFLSCARQRAATDGKTVSAIALNLLTAVRKAVDMNDEELSASIAKGSMAFCERVVENENEDEQSEERKVANSHYISNCLDGLNYIAKSGVNSYNFHKSIYYNFSDAFSGAKLEENQTHKIFELADSLLKLPRNSYNIQAADTVHAVGFSWGAFDNAGMHNVLSKNPSAIFAAVANSNFTADHLQHFRPAKFFSDMQDSHTDISKELGKMNELAEKFFTSLRENDTGNRWNDEDKVKILHKGFEYLNEHSKYSKEDDIDSIDRVIEQVCEASKTPTQVESCLNFIASNGGMSTVPFLVHLKLTPDQTEIAVNHLERGMDFFQSMPKISNNYIKKIVRNTNYNKNTFDKIKNTWANDRPLEVLSSAVKNKNITDEGVKDEILNSVVELKNKKSKNDDGLDKLFADASGMPNIRKNQFDILTSDIELPQIFKEGSFYDNSILKNVKFGGDKFRDLGITHDMSDKFKKLVHQPLNVDGPIKFHHGKDLESFNTLLGMVPPAGLHWKDFKKANPKLAENQKIKSLFMANKERVTPDLVTGAMSNLPGSYHITFGEWDGIQRHSKNKNLVVQFNLDKSFEDYIAQDPETHKFFVDMSCMCNHGHPTAPRTLFWSRLDANSQNGWIIEEIQSDFDSTLRSTIRNMNDSGTVEINGTEYSKGQLEKFGKYFSKILSDHVDVAHKYIEQLAKQHNVKALFLHGKEKRAKLSGMDSDRNVPEWLEYKYQTWPSKNGWNKITDEQYPSGHETKHGKPAWMKKLS